MNKGMEFALQSVFRAMGVTPEVVLTQIQQIVEIAMQLNQRIDRIENKLDTLIEENVHEHQDSEKTLRIEGAAK